MLFGCVARSYGKMKLRRSLMLTIRSPMFLLPSVAAAAVFLLSRPMEAVPDLRESIINGNEPCFRYTVAKRLFRMNCSVLYWETEGYGPDSYISLGANEIFDGRESCIDLSGVMDFTGLFAINDSEVTTFAKAPLIKNVHVRNGTTAKHGGFIVRKEQKFSIIDSCSSTGDIAKRGGGICGRRCGGGNGEIKISNSYSTGRIMGEGAGGITGRRVGHNGGSLHITQCHSTGNIEGTFAGGICGDVAGYTNGTVHVKRSYSAGDIVGTESGGIAGASAGSSGHVYIQECYSTGQISAEHSGGISGSNVATFEGEVQIIDCYTRGDVGSSKAGGITGNGAGGWHIFGNVYIKSTYASGMLKHTDAGGIIGGIQAKFHGHTVHVQYSVYNHTDEEKIIGLNNGDNLDDTGNSNNLTNIRGRLYHYDGIQRWDKENWVINGTDTLPILRFQLMGSVSSPSLSPLTARRRILPVQRPPRSVRQHSSRRKRRRKGQFHIRPNSAYPVSNTP